MADTKLADLTALTAPSGDDLLYVVDDPAGTPADRKLALDNLFTRGTVTASSPVIDAAQTWNNAAVTFTGLKLNVTSTASASNSRLLDIQLGGASTFQVLASSSISAAYVRVLAGGQNLVGLGSLNANIPHVAIQSSGAYGWSVSSDAFSGTYDLILTRKAAASLRLGAADAASPVAQTLGVQSVVAGTTNTAGANFTIAGSQGTGTGAGGSIIFKVAPAGSSGTAQNALATAWQISGAGHLLAGTDNTYDIGTTGATRPRSIYVGTFIRVEGASSYIRLESPDIICNRAGTVYIYNNNASGSLRLGTTNAANGIYIDASATSTFDGAIRFSTDNTYDIGASGASRPRDLFVGGGMTTGAPAGGTAAKWKLGTVATVSPTSPNRTIEVDIGGTIYYIHAKTTND